MEQNKKNQTDRIESKVVVDIAHQWEISFSHPLIVKCLEEKGHHFNLLIASKQNKKIKQTKIAVEVISWHSDQ